MTQMEIATITAYKKLVRDGRHSLPQQPEYVSKYAIINLAMENIKKVTGKNYDMVSVERHGLRQLKRDKKSYNRVYYYKLEV